MVSGNSGAGCMHPHSPDNFLLLLKGIPRPRRAGPFVSPIFALRGLASSQFVCGKMSLEAPLFQPLSAQLSRQCFATKFMLAEVTRVQQDMLLRFSFCSSVLALDKLANRYARRCCILPLVNCILHLALTLQPRMATPHPTSLSMAMDLVDSRKKKRRIPPNLRRRALVSCDRCKQRRVRCIRQGESNENEPCQSCIENGVKCESTLPRKHRIYGSVENLSLRYRVLDAIVKGLYPDRDVTNIETLYSIAEANNISLPPNTGESPDEHVLFRSSSPGNRLGTESTRSPSVMSSRDHANPFESHPSRVMEEKLVPAPHGASHYIGPSSSFSFVVMVRNLVAEHNAASRILEPNDERVSLQADFVRLRASKALEPHANAGEDNSSHPEIQRRQDRQHPNPDLATKRKRDAIGSLLPAREVADALIEAYFDRVHPNYMIFHRGTFQVRYESMWIEARKPIQEFEPGLVCSVFMMFVFGAQALEHHDEQKSVQMQRQYLDLVQSRTYQLLHTTSLLNVQALLLFQLHQHNATERNTSWMLLGSASRMALALGMHREGATGGFDSIEREVRRRVWWTLYIFEQNLCTILGRPSAIDDLEVTISLPNENLLDGADCVPPSYMDYSVRLAKLSSEIKRKIYAVPNGSMNGSEVLDTSTASHLVQRLESWHRSLPPYIRLECLSLVPKQRRAVLLLHIQYHHAQSLITRPFILRKTRTLIAQQADKNDPPTDLDPKELELSHSCGTSARKVAILLQQLAAGGMFEGVAWLDAYYLYHCILIVSLDFLARPTSQKDTQEDIARKAAVQDVVEAVRNMKLCSTFTILTQVALQFAKIVGVYDECRPERERAAEANSARHMPSQAATVMEFRQQNDVEGLLNQWFQNDSVSNLPWDFFSDGGYGGMNHFYQPDMPIAGTLAGYVPAVDGDPTRMPLASGNMYPGWGTVGESYSQSTGGSAEYSPASEMKG
jgi:proline utilization trans-activator